MGEQDNKIGGLFDVFNPVESNFTYDKKLQNIILSGSPDSYINYDKYNEIITNQKYNDTSFSSLKNKIKSQGLVGSAIADGYSTPIMGDDKLKENIEIYLDNTIKPLINKSDIYGTKAILREIVDTLVCHFVVMGVERLNDTKGGTFGFPSFDIKKGLTNGFKKIAESNTGKSIKDAANFTKNYYAAPYRVLGILPPLKASKKYYIDYSQFENLKKEIPPIIHEYSQFNSNVYFEKYYKRQEYINFFYDKNENNIIIINLIKNLNEQTENFVNGDNEDFDNFIEKFIKDLAGIIMNITKYKNNKLLLAVDKQHILIKNFLKDFRNKYPNLILSNPAEKYNNDNNYKKFIFNGNLLLIKSFVLLSPFIYVLDNRNITAAKNINFLLTKDFHQKYIMDELLYKQNNFTNASKDKQLLFQKFNVQIKLFKIFGELYSKPENIITENPEKIIEYERKTYNIENPITEEPTIANELPTDTPPPSGGSRRSHRLRKTTKNKTGKKVAKKSAKNKTAKKKT